MKKTLVILALVLAGLAGGYKVTATLEPAALAKFRRISDSSFGTRARIVSAGLLSSASRPARLRFRQARFLRASKISPDFPPHSSASALSICLWMKMWNTPAA